MKTARHLPANKKQQGIALLMLVIILVLAMSSYYLSTISIAEIKLDRERETRTALKQAKQALIAYAVSRTDLDSPVVTSAQPGRYGFLPCPANTRDTVNNGDGRSVGTCGLKGWNTVGWLPWYSLNIAPLRDGNKDCLYYAVSGSYKVSPDADMLNEDSYGQLQIIDENGIDIPGSAAEDRVVAIIFSVGEVTNTQVRNFLLGSECGYNGTPNSSFPENYLDALLVPPGVVVDNSDADAGAGSIDRFVNALTSVNEDVMNDRLLTITRDEIWQAVFKRNNFNQKMENLTQALALCLAEYANQPNNDSRRLPWPVKTDLNGAADYRDKNNYQDDENANLIGHGYSGRFPFNIASSNDAINSVVMTNDELINTAGLCNNLSLGGGIFADLETPGAEYRELWNNWKDHFFYVLSKVYAPASTGETDCTLGNCISINAPAKKYAAAVIYSGARLALKTRSDKAVVADYLEDTKPAQYINESFSRNGFQTYLYTDPQTVTENDIMYCVEDVAASSLGAKVNPTTNLLTVVECS